VGLDPIAMDDGRTGLRGMTARIFAAVLIVGFALVLGFTWNELDAAVKGASSSLATIATIGD
jgi:hypothetical protein